MSKKLIEIPELHNNDYDFFDVLKGLCKVKVTEVKSQTEQTNDDNKSDSQSGNSKQFITSQNE